MTRVLIVDDDEDMLYFASALLSREGACLNVVTAASALEALRILPNRDFDVIVSDYKMPGMNGLELLRDIRNQGNDIPFIMFTGQGREEVAIDALNMGANHYLKKEGNPDSLYHELAHTIKQLANHRKTERNLQETRVQAQKYLDIASVILVALDRDGIVTMINRKGCAVLGYSEEEIVGKEWFETFLPERMHEETRAVFSKLMEGKFEPVEYFENPVITKNGDERLIAWHNTVLIEKGSIEGTISSGDDITERRQAEKALQESEERFRTIFQESNDGIALVEIAEDGHLGFFSEANDAFCQLTGLYMGEITNFIPRDLLATEEYERIKQEGIAGNWHNEDRTYLETILSNKDGTKKAVEVSSLRIWTNNKPFCLLIVHDITERKQADEALRESEERFRTIFQESNDGIAVVEITQDGHLGFFVDANDAFCQLTGLHTGEISKFVPRDLVSPNEFERLKKEGIIGNWLSDDPVNFEAVFLSRDGTTKLTEVSAPKISLENQQFRLMMVQDITNRKLTEAALKESEKRYRSVVEQSIQGLAILQDSRFVFANPALAEMYGGSINELLALSPEDAWGRVHPEDRDTIWKSYQERLQGKPIPARTEYRVFDKDGQIRWILSYGTLTTFHGKPAIQSIYIDITDRKHAEQQLTQQKEELSEFAHAMNHDLRNYLIAVKGYAALLQCKPEPMHAKRICKLVDQIEELLQRSVLLADAGLIADVTNEVDLNQLVQDIAAVTIPSTTSFIQEDLPVVMGDYEKLTQVFKNLFENAMTHGEAENIIVRQNGSKNGISIDITNDGTIIPPKYRSQLFRRGFSTKKRGGLGLTIVQKIINAHGWQISLSDAPQTTFCIKIPA
ncbi:MAG: PAS domain S-box protein [Candidatus Hodarchaeales archaeon]